jgi:shikimate 5-dehydrogenase
MTVADVSHVDDASEFLNEARVRGCQVVEPADMLQANVAAVFKTITGQDLPEGTIPD